MLRQSTRSEAYRAALDELGRVGLLYRCRCSRRSLTDTRRYPGTCRERHWPPGVPAALRLRVDPGVVSFVDRWQGPFSQDVAAQVGDFIVQRRDGLVAYVLAVVVDDAAQGITDVVRGADLLDHTPSQIWLQRLLGLPTPSYCHVPLLVEADGSKLAKSRRSVALRGDDAASQLYTVLRLLGLAPISPLAGAPLAEIWRWALEAWKSLRPAPRLTIPLASAGIF